MDELFLQLQTALAGEYSIERELGRGGMGVVYLAREVRLAREVAIKVLPPALAESPPMREQFLREAQTAARLSHPNIVPIHRVDETAGFVYFVMAYVNGETLAERIRSRGPLPPHQAARVLREVAWALTYAHSNGIIHRDIKAENILLERGTERALVTDFGIAGAAQAAALGSDGQIAGSAHYASPEQIAGEPLDPASDIYSLGVTGFLTLTGRLPFDAPTTREVLAMHLNTLPPSVTAFAPTIPEKLGRVIQRCLAKRAEHRYHTASAFADAIDQSVEQPRDIPAPLRVWVNRTNQAFRLQVFAGLYLTFGAGVPLAVSTHSVPLGLAVALTAVTGIIALPSVLRTHRVVAAGYGIDDIRATVREFWLRKREEEFYELSGPTRSLARRTFWLIFGGSTLGAVGLTALAGQHVFTGVGLPILATMSWAFALGAGLLGLNDWSRLRRLGKMGNFQMKFYNSAWGERFVRASSWGLKNKPKAAGLPQLTEVALGRATDALYDALPKSLRKQLKQLPATVKRLEEDAKKLRGEIDKLDASIAQLDGDAGGTIPSAIADSAHEARIRADRDNLSVDLRMLRERAADRLAATVAALENIRLDLLRLQLGDGHVASVTASLEAAHDVAADLSDYVSATREVERAIAHRTAPIAHRE
jgi:eukaryotic-like serine/threonine-protein kinase